VTSLKHFCGIETASRFITGELKKADSKSQKMKNDCVELSQEDFKLLLDGIDISKLQRFPELHYAVVG